MAAFIDTGKLTGNRLIVISSAVLVLFYNFTFFKHFTDVYPLVAENIAFILSVCILLFTVTALLLSVVGSRYTIKPILIFIFICSSLASYFMDSYNIIVDSTMIRAWGTDSELSQLRLEIEKENWPGTWLDGENLASRKVPKDDVFGRAIYLLEQGCIFAPSFLGGRVAGMHGYDTSCSCSKAALVSDRPIDDKITGIDDIAGIVRDRLNLI